MRMHALRLKCHIPHTFNGFSWRWNIIRISHVYKNEYIIRYHHIVYTMDAYLCIYRITACSNHASHRRALIDERETGEIVCVHGATPPCLAMHAAYAI